MNTALIPKFDLAHAFVFQKNSIPVLPTSPFLEEIFESSILKELWKLQPSAIVALLISE